MTWAALGLEFKNLALGLGCPSWTWCQVQVLCQGQEKKPPLGGNSRLSRKLLTEDGLDKFQASIGEGMVQLQSRLKGLALQVLSTDGLGRPSGFSAEFGVTNAVDRICYLCETVETLQDNFKRVPDDTTVSRVNNMETTLQAFELQQSTSLLMSDLDQKV